MVTEDSPQGARPVRFGNLSPEQARSIDRICDHFEHQLYVKGQTEIEALLGGFREPERSVLLRELLLLELETCLSRDVFPAREEYYGRFPDHRELVTEVFETVFPPAAAVEKKPEMPWPSIPNYQILREVSHGGMGRVYEAIHTSLGTRVAVKVLRENLASDVEAEARFEREMRVIGTLSHPNIVAARDAGKSSGCHYLVMEYVSGLDLEVLRQRVGTLAVADACEIARRVAFALRYAHEHNLVHRDIKPKNILLGRCSSDSDEIQVKVVDFGLASLRGYAALRDPAIKYARIVGTYAYMAPEQFWEQTNDVRSDIYSLGCTLYCLLLGRPPFGRPQYQNSEQIMEAHRDMPIPPMRRLRPDVPESLERAIVSMMAKDPKQRPQAPMQAADVLSGFSEGHDLAGLLAAAESAGLQPVLKAPFRKERPEKVAVVDKSRPHKEAAARRDVELAETVDYRPREFSAEAPRPESDTSPLESTVVHHVEERKMGDLRTALRPILGKPRFLFAVGAVLALALVVFGLWALRTPPLATVDLLALIASEREEIDGLWKFDGRGLVSPASSHARLQIPYSPPKEYRLEIEARLVSGAGRLVIGLPYEGRQVPVVLGTVVVVRPNAEESPVVPGSVSPPFEFDGAPPNTYTCIVRREGILVALGNKVLRWLECADLPQRDETWHTENPDVLFLGTDESIYRFTKAVLTPLRR